MSDEDNTPKPNLNDGILNEHGIFYLDTFSPKTSRNTVETALPRHGAALKRALLNFGSPLHHDVEELFESQRQTFLSKLSEKERTSKAHWETQPPREFFYKPEQETRAEKEVSKQSEMDFESKKKITEEAASVKQAQSLETTWTRFLHAKIFKPFREAVASYTPYE